MLICIFGVYATPAMATYQNYYDMDWQHRTTNSNVTLTDSSPKDGQSDVQTDVSITLKFSGNISRSLPKADTDVNLCDSLNRKIKVDIKTKDDDKLIIKPKNKLNNNTFYKLNLNNLKDSNGMIIKSFCVTFTTGNNANNQNNRFTDVDSNHWAFNAIIELNNRGIISGYSDKSFKPNENVTRSQFASMLTKALNLTTTSNKQTFEDIPVTSWDYKAVEAAKMYLTGYKTSSGKMYFYGNKSSVREDMAVALVKALGLNVTSNDNKLKEAFSDYNSISENLRSYVYTAYNDGIMLGSNRQFNPQGLLTRAEAASLLLKVVEKSEKVAVDDLDNIDKVVVDDTDNKSHNAALSSLKYNNINVDGFNKNLKVYTVVLPVDTKNIPYVTANTSNLEAKVNITQATQLPGMAKIVVTAEDGKTTMTYTVYFQIKANNDARLKSLQYMGNAVDDFNDNVTYYTVKLGTKDSIPIVTAMANDPNAKVTINQATNIPGTATVIVTAEDNKNTLSYRIYFYN